MVVWKEEGDRVNGSIKLTLVRLDVVLRDVDGFSCYCREREEDLEKVEQTEGRWPIVLLQ